MTTHSIKTIWRENKIFDTIMSTGTPSPSTCRAMKGMKQPVRVPKTATGSRIHLLGLDIVAMAEKMRIDLKGFDIRIDAQVAEASQAVHLHEGNLRT